MAKTLVLDAMGVIYKAADDVVELLIPFVQTHGGVPDAKAIDDAYMRASRGEMTSREFWLSVNVNPNLEDDFLSGHSLNDGLLAFLPKAQEVFASIMCLSNDVSEWSAKLRHRFGLEKYISQFFISGDMHLRKPDVCIYERMLEMANLAAEDVVFVDDRTKNLFPARDLGMACVLFNPVEGQETAELPIARSFQDLLQYA